MSNEGTRMIIVTGSSNVQRAEACLRSWQENGATSFTTVVVRNGTDVAPMPDSLKRIVEVKSEDYLGSVPAFALGVQTAMRLDSRAEIIACLHDDLEIFEDGWDVRVLEHFASHPHTGLAGFFGASGIGDDDIYKKPYEPWQLARNGCRSNIEGAEAHGARSVVPSRVAVLDGFSLIGRAAFFAGEVFGTGEKTVPPWDMMASLGLVHHIYDGALGMLAARRSWDTYFLPVRCMHYGGRTAVADAGYAAWAAKRIEGGDQGLWNEGHRKVYDEFRDVLPLRVGVGV